jgi:hypothetical protein
MNRDPNQARLSADFRETTSETVQDRSQVPLLLRRMLGRRKEMARAGREAAVPDMCVYEASAGKTVALVTLLELAPDASEAAVVDARRRFPIYRDLVFVTDNPDFSALRRTEVMFEYIPSLKVQQMTGADLDWKLFLEQKYDLLLAKWRPLKIIAYGVSFEDLIAKAGTSAPQAGGVRL